MEYDVRELQDVVDTMDELEELAQAYMFLDKNHLKDCGTVIQDEFIDTYMKSHSAGIIFQYITKYLDGLNVHNDNEQRIANYCLQNKSSEKYFGTLKKLAFDQLRKKWFNTQSLNMLDISFEKDLDNLRNYYVSYFSEKFNLPSPNYQEVLTRIYGKEFVGSCCDELKKYRKKIICFYKQSLLSKNVPSHATVSELNITEQKAIYFFNHFLNQVTSLTKKFKITVEFCTHANVVKLHHRIFLYLSPYLSFSTSLFEFLGLFGEIYSKFLKEDSFYNATEEIAIYHNHACRYYGQLLPVISLDFSKMISEYYSEIGTPEKVFRILLKNFLVIRRNPTSESNMNLIENFLTNMIGFELEEKWFNGEISSCELLEKWQEMVIIYFGNSSSNVLEISLRIFRWLLEGIGIHFLELGISLSAFERGMLNEQYYHPFQNFLKHFRNHTLSQWQEDEKFLLPHKINDEEVQYFLFYFSYLYQQMFS